jgi:RNA polymerase-interacting CarD/CdnL/TRCF family regulator
VTFKIGDTVVHRAYGPGKITAVEEKTLSGEAQLYYVVQIKDMTLWVPVEENGNGSSLRKPTPAVEYEKLFDILKSDGRPLSTDRLERKNQLQGNMRSGDLEGICRVIRDLNTVNRVKKLNENDNALFQRAQNLLLSEWSISLDVPLPVAEHELNTLLSATE